MRTRFHAEPIVRASELLLQERTPRDVAVARPRMDTARDRRRRARTGAAAHPPFLVALRRDAAHPAAVQRPLRRDDHRGGIGLQPLAATSRSRAGARMRPATTPGRTSCCATSRRGERWSAGFQPSGAVPESYDVSFAEDRAEFVRRDGAITDAARSDRVVGGRRRGPAGLAHQPRLRDAGDRGHVVRGGRARAGGRGRGAPGVLEPVHPDGDASPTLDTLLATRRRRDAGRRRDLARPRPGRRGRDGRRRGMGNRSRRGSSGVDAASARRSRKPAAASSPTRSARCSTRSSACGAASASVPARPCAWRSRRWSRRRASAVLDLADKYHDVTTFERVATLAWTQAQVQLHHLGIGADEAHLFQTLGGAIVVRAIARCAPPATCSPAAPKASRRSGRTGSRATCRSCSWRSTTADDIGIVRQLLRAHAYWRMKRLAVDLVILNDRAPVVPAGPADADRDAGAHEPVDATAGRARSRRARSSRSARTALTAGQRDVLESVARVDLSSRRGTLAEQVARAYRDRRRSARSRRAHDRAAAAPEPTRRVESRRRARRWSSTTDIGGFDADGARVRDRSLRAGPVDAGAVDQRDRQPGFRLPRVRGGIGLHLVGQQPGEPAHRRGRTIR